MLFIVAAVLAVLWLLGLLFVKSIGLFIHILLVAAIIALIFGFVSGRSTAA